MSFNILLLEINTNFKVAVRIFLKHSPHENHERRFESVRYATECEKRNNQDIASAEILPFLQLIYSPKSNLGG